MVARRGSLYSSSRSYYTNEVPPYPGSVSTFLREFIVLELVGSFPVVQIPAHAALPALTILLFSRSMSLS